MNWLLVALWGGAVGLDATSVVQAMISRPFVATTVTGVIVGRPVEALAIGITLEIFSLVILPIGAARYPESGVGAVAATVAYAWSAAPPFDTGALVLAVVFGLVWERIAGLSVTALRQLNSRLVAAAPARGRLGPGRLERLHLAAIALDGARAVGIVLLGSLIGGLLVQLLTPHWWLTDATTLGIISVAAATVLGATLSLFSGWSSRYLVALIGVLCGLVFLYYR